MTDYILRLGVVKNETDPTGAGRIQVRIPGSDLKTPDNGELSWVFPLLPKMLHVHPKIGESVFIIGEKMSNQFMGRFYIGPIIPQPQNMYEAKEENRALSLLEGSEVTPYPNPENYAQVKGALPTYEDVAILGRSESDIILKDNDIRIRCGSKKRVDPLTVSDKDYKKQTGLDFAFNGVHPAFIKMKHYDGRKSKITDKNVSLGYESVINVVADKINLIGCDSRDNYKLDDPEELISEEEVARFVTEAHQLPFGDKLIEFLRIFIAAFQSHTHPWVGRGMTPCKDITYKQLADYNLESILSTTTRIN